MRIAAFNVWGRGPGETAGIHRLIWSGATWCFAGAENRDRFAKAPEKYAPQYGGNCAYGVANGYTVKTGPQAWSVVGGSSISITAKEKSWKADIPGYIKKADANGPAALSCNETVRRCITDAHFVLRAPSC